MNNDEIERIIKSVLQAQQPVVPIITMEEWLVTYRRLLLNKSYATQTIKNRLAGISRIEKAFGTRSMVSIKPYEISDLLSECSPNTASRLLGEIRNVYYEAIANGIVEVNPGAHIKPVKVTRLRKRLTLDVWQSMLDTTWDSNISWQTPLLLLALATGQRRGDLVKMQFSDVVDGYLRVEQQKKAGKPIGARLALPLTLRLNAIGATLGDIVEFCKIGNPGPTLLRKANGSAIEISSLSSRFHELILKVLGDVSYSKYECPSLHEVRSLSARTYIEEGMPINVVQSLLGHKHIEMTTVYLDDRGLRAADWKVVNY